MPSIIVVTSFEKLKQKYSSSYSAIEKISNAYFHALEADNYDLYIVDVSPDVCQKGPFFIKRFLENHPDYYNYDHLIIIGNDDVVPFFQVDSDILPWPIFSDSLYTDQGWTIDRLGSQNVKLEELVDFQHLPKMSVGRIPDASDYGLELFENEINTYIRLHESKGSKLPNRVGFTTSRWEEPSKKVFKILNPKLDKLLVSPPVGLDLSNEVFRKVSPQLFAKDSWFYFNVHGNRENNLWFGERNVNYFGKVLTKKVFPKLLSAQTILDAPVQNSFVCTSACHATNISGMPVSNNIALSFLNQGCIGVIGPSGISFGYSLKSKNRPSGLTGIDLILYSVLMKIVDGKSIGTALRDVKAFSHTDNFEDDINIIGCTLLGDPTLSILG